MKIVSQKEKHNKITTQRALEYGRQQREKPMPQNYEAAVVMGEYIARKNNNKDTKLEDVLDYYKPSFYQKRKDT